MQRAHSDQSFCNNMIFNNTDNPVQGLDIGRKTASPHKQRAAGTQYGGALFIQISSQSTLREYLRLWL